MITRVVVGVLALTVLAAALGVARYLLVRHHGRGIQVRVTLPDDPDAAAITRALWMAGVIDRPWLFHGLALVTGAADGAHPGLMVLRDDLTPREVLRTLASGQQGLVRVTIPEGYNRYDIARRLAAAGVITDANAFVTATSRADILARHGAPEGTSMEGRLFPDTYDLPVGASPESVIDRMGRDFERRWEVLKAAHPTGLARANTVMSPGAAQQSVLILASIVERETGAPEDRAHVASVFWNRLTLRDFHPRLLQSDPTVVYGCLVAPTPACTRSSTNDAGSGFAADGGDSAQTDAAVMQDGAGHTVITAAMLLDDDNAYNTYRHEGLPPGPVCNPGVRALEAVLEPTDSHDVYFVARGDGRSVFAATLEEHTRNVARYLRRSVRDAAP